MMNTAVNGKWFSYDAVIGYDDRNFFHILWPVLVLFLLVSVIITIINVPRVQQTTDVTVGPRFARLLVEPPAPPPSTPRQVEPPKPEVREETPPPPEKPKPSQEEVIRSAREKASRSGLLALKSQLSDITNNQVIENIHKRRALDKAADIPVQKTSTDVLDSAVTEASKGLDARALEYELGQQQLDARQVTQLDSPVTGAGTRQDNGRGRSWEEIQLVMDSNKGKLNALYNRALRKNPVIAGKLVLRMTIDPAGRVINCEIVSSELGAPDLERKLVARILLFEFPARDVETTTVTYPIEFYPR